MTLEQELVRLFGNCARNSAGYQVPYSACSVMSSQIGSPAMKVCQKLSSFSLIAEHDRKKPALSKCLRGEFDEKSEERTPLDLDQAYREKQIEI